MGFPTIGGYPTIGGFPTLFSSLEVLQGSLMLPYPPPEHISHLFSLISLFCLRFSLPCTTPATTPPPCSFSLTPSTPFPFFHVPPQPYPLLLSLFPPLSSTNCREKVINGGVRNCGPSRSCRVPETPTRGQRRLGGEEIRDHQRRRQGKHRISLLLLNP